MKLPWKSISVFLSGVIAGILILFRLKEPEKVVNAENYIKEQQQKVGKIKQKGEGNGQQVHLEHKLSGKEKRASRKAERKSRKSK